MPLLRGQNDLLAKLKSWEHGSSWLTLSSTLPSLYLISSPTSYPNKLFNLFIPLATRLLILLLLTSTILTPPTRADLQMADVIAIKEGGDLDLSCPIVVSQEDMIISWTCDDEPANIKSSRIHVTDSGKLRIKSAKVGDSCNYRCEAADGFGTISVIIKVIIVDKRLMEQLSRHNRTYNPTETTINPLNEQYKNSTSTSQGAISTIGENNSTNENDYTLNEFQVTIIPDFIHIGKNQTFTLECRVKHPQYLIAPQIIWLKEFIGQRPDSINEAHERNLVAIDNIFYHSLNWPRSITYTKKSASANSALLIRQTNFVHSGRYVCFAGYPPHIMSYNFTTDSSPLDSTVQSDFQLKKIKYKWALAVVRVDDPEGEENHRLSMESAAVTGEWDQDLKQKNLLYSVFATNTWTRNLTASLMLFCGILYFGKIILLKYTRSKNNNKNDEDNATGVAETGNIASEQNDINISLRDSGTLAIKQLQSNNFYHKQGQSGPHSTSIVGLKANTDLIENYQDDPQSFEFNFDKDLACDEESNHFYSEISDTDNKQRESANNSLYKIPNIKANIDHQEDS